MFVSFSITPNLPSKILITSHSKHSIIEELGLYVLHGCNRYLRINEVHVDPQPLLKFSSALNMVMRGKHATEYSVICTHDCHMSENSLVEDKKTYVKAIQLLHMFV